MGPLDRAIRLAAGVVLVPVGLFALGGVVGGIARLVVAGVGVTGLVTGATGFCPYVPFGFSTVRRTAEACGCGPACGGSHGAAARVRISPRPRGMRKCEEMFDRMPDGFRPKRMMRGIDEVRDQNVEILGLLRNRDGRARLTAVD